MKLWASTFKGDNFERSKGSYAMMDTSKTAVFQRKYLGTITVSVKDFSNQVLKDSLV